MSIAKNHEIQQFGHKFGKTEILHLAIPAWKSAWTSFPV